MSKGIAGGEKWAPPPAEPHRTPECLHVEEERGRTATSGLTLALLGNLPGLFAVLAAHREGEGAQPLLGDLFAALEAVAVIALLERASASLILLSVSDFIWISANSISS